MSKILANSLNKVIPSLIHMDQVGFIAGRTILTLLTILYILWQYWHLVVSRAIPLHAEKAFDMVEWRYLLEILEAFVFGNTFIIWIKLLFEEEPLAAVQTNGSISDYFPPSRGIWQGCPLSPLLFCLALQPLAASIREREAFDFSEIMSVGEAHKHLTICFWSR